MSGGHFAGLLTPLTCQGSKGAHNVQWTLALCGPERSGDVPHGKFRDSPKAGSGAKYRTILCRIRHFSLIIPAYTALFLHYSFSPIISNIVPAISATLHLNHFLFLLQNIEIAVINISQIFSSKNVTTADLFFCYSLFTKLFCTAN